MRIQLGRRKELKPSTKPAKGCVFLTKKEYEELKKNTEYIDCALFTGKKFKSAEMLNK